MWSAEVVLCATAAVHATLSCFILIYHRHLRTEPWDRSFGIFIFSMAVASVGYALSVAAVDLAAGARAQALASIGLLTTGYAFVDYQQRVTDERRSAVLILTRVTWALLVLACATGHVHHFDTPVGEAAFRFFDAPSYRLAKNSALGMLIMLLAPPVILVNFERLVRHPGPQPLNRAGQIAFVLTQLCMLNDLGVWSGFLQSYFMAPVAALACTGVMSLIILRRFIDDRDALLQRRAALQRNYRELRRARDELVSTEQLVALGELSAVIAHEVRNPLTVIKQAASGLRRRGEPGRQRHLVAIVDEEASRLRELVNDLLVYAKPLRVERAPYDLAADVASMVAEVLVAEGRSGQVSFDLQLDGPVMQADGHLLRQALRNVVRNAVQASPDGEAISVVVDHARMHGLPAVRVMVRDRGPGMEDGVRAKALDPFFTTRAKGTGLGLAIVDRVVAAHGGELSLQPAADRGMQVVMLIPRDGPPA